MEQKAAHSIALENRKRLKVTGVAEVESFAEQEVRLTTGAGALLIFGTDMHLSRYNPDEGLLLLTGEIIAIEYPPPSKQKRGVLGKFKM
ncbi:MAG: YabP/YqfC family sporulation protein [Clostridiales bacterium]|nr:YabP/YqfC family sporulation protein [Clostridiales bacterium]